MLTKTRLMGAAPELVVYCLTCRDEVVGLECEDGEELRCPRCLGGLELAEVMVTELDVSTVDFPQILEDCGLPRDCASFDALRCVHHKIVDEDVARVQ
jgi:hypothetical protein